MINPHLVLIRSDHTFIDVLPPGYFESTSLIITTGIVRSDLLKTPKIIKKTLFQGSNSSKTFPAGGGKNSCQKITLIPQNYTQDLGFWSDGARADAERKQKCDRPNELGY